MQLELNNDNWYKKLMFKLIESKYLVKNSKKRASWITTYLLTRAMLYANSMEFV